MEKKLQNHIPINESGIKKLLLTMKLALIIFFLSALHVSANVYSQITVNLDVRDKSIREVLKTIEQQSQVRFFYSDDLLQMNNLIDVKSDNENIIGVLDEIFKDSPLTYKTYENNLIVIGPREMLQQQKITGTITDKSGAPIPGANVVVTGTTQGTMTDIGGKYTIEVPTGSKSLTFSFTGMAPQEVNIGTLSQINVTLSESTVGLDEVVVVGYGTQRKVTVTGSVVSAKGDDLKQAPVSSITNSLVGRLPGLIAMNVSGEPGFDDAMLLIRGNNTLGNNNPLVVVDGVADRAGGFSHIDASDIESVTILKDASAAIYGSRAANGVILVTTKRGQEGKSNITYSAEYGLESPTVLPRMLSSADYATVENEIAAGTWTAAEIQKFRDGSDPLHYPNISPIKEALKKYSLETKHNLSVSGGTGKVNYFTSLGYQYSDNMYKESASNYQQYNLRSNIDVQVNKRLKIFANLSLREQDQNSPFESQQGNFGAAGLWRNILQGDPTKVITWPNGKLNQVTSGGFNPIASVNGMEGYQKYKTTLINADLGFNLDLSFITNGLGIDGGLYVDKTNYQNKNFYKTYTLYSLDPSDDNNFIPQRCGPANANLNNFQSQNLGITENIKLRYNRTFNNVHNVAVFVAYEQYTSSYEELFAQRQQFVSPALDQIFAGPSPGTNNGTGTESARQNYFGRFDYSYSEKYLLQFNWRYDGSENFPKNNRFGFFPGVSAGWRISEEQFWKNSLPFINYFKIRGSWGKMGNDAIQVNGVDQHFNYLTTYTFGSPGVFGGGNPLAYTGISQVATANPNITWEVATTYNIGFDTKFLQNAFNLEFDLFKQRRTNILIPPTASVPQYAGLSLPFVNDATCESIGFEVALGYTKTLANDFRFSIGGNFSYAHSNVVNINEPATTPEYQKMTGKPIGAGYGADNGLVYQTIGIYRTAADLTNYPYLGNATLGDLIFKDVNGDGIIDGNDRIRPARTVTPEITYGITMNATYKNWELSMLWQGNANVWQYTFFEGGAGGIGNYTQHSFDIRWTPDNVNSAGPKLFDRENASSGRFNTYYVNNTSYTRLKNLMLSYSLPEKIISKLTISKLRIFVSGSNLLTICGIKDLDPETRASNQGYAGWYNPQMKIYNFGLNLTF